MSRPMTTDSKLSSDEWCTPKWLADALGRFDLDPCSNERSHVVASERIILGAETQEIKNGWIFGGDGLAYDWGNDSVFCNPPYSDVGPWARKLADHEGPWAALLKLDPTTRWWSTLMQAGPTVAPFRKRIKFEGDREMTANFPSVLVYSAWRPSRELARYLWIATYEQALEAAPGAQP